ncbi:hypothetical protein ACLOJK_029052 [Asimina triloba]
MPTGSVALIKWFARRVYQCAVLRNTMDKDVELKQWPSHDLNMADDARYTGDEGMEVSRGRGMKGEGGRWEMKGGKWDAGGS